MHLQPIGHSVKRFAATEMGGHSLQPLAAHQRSAAFDDSLNATRFLTEDESAGFLPLWTWIFPRQRPILHA